MKLHTDKALFTEAIQATSQEMNLAPEFVEKDYWICQILQHLSRHPLKERIVWKGGTSLSKAYGLIKRFSSDVDFAVLLEGLTQNQQKKLVTRIGKETTFDFEELDLPELTIKNNHFRKTYHAYKSVITAPTTKQHLTNRHYGRAQILCHLLYLRISVQCGKKYPEFTSLKSVRLPMNQSQHRRISLIHYILFSMT